MFRGASEKTVEIAGAALRAAAGGPFFEDWEFQTLLGVTRETVREVYAAWPEQTVDDVTFACAVIGAMNNLLGYPHRRDLALFFYVAASREDLSAALDELIALRDAAPTALDPD
jgi:hypothetical protein